MCTDSTLAVVTFNFTASVTASGDPVILVGDSIQGSISYDSTQLGSAGVYTFTGSAKTHTFSFKDYRNSVLITSDAYAGLATSLYQITMSIVNSVTQMNVKGVTLAGRTVAISFKANANLGTTLPASVANFNTSAGTFTC
jgi:hypothetical protein